MDFEKDINGVKSHDLAGQGFLITETGNYTTRAAIQSFLGLCGTVLLKPRVLHIHVLRFRPKKVDFHVAIANIINRWCLASRIFEEERSDDASSPKSSPTSDALSIVSQLFFQPQMRQFSRSIKMKIILLEKPSLFLNIARNALLFIFNNPELY